MMLKETEVKEQIKALINEQREVTAAIHHNPNDDERLHRLSEINDKLMRMHRDYPHWYHETTSELFGVH